MAGAEKSGEQGIEQKRKGLVELHVSGTKETGKTSPFLSPGRSKNNIHITVKKAEGIRF